MSAQAIRNSDFGTVVHERRLAAQEELDSTHLTPDVRELVRLNALHYQRLAAQAMRVHIRLACDLVHDPALEDLAPVKI